MMSFPIVLMVYPMSHLHQLYLLAVKGLASWVGWQIINNGFKSFMKKDFHFYAVTFTTYLNQKRVHHWSITRLTDICQKIIVGFISFFNLETKNVIEHLQNDMMK